MNKIISSTKLYFKFSERSTTFKKEIIGGLSTFLAMAYILAVNPGMLSQANGAAGYTGVFFFGTALSAMIGTLAMGLKANIPVALAPGMGVNAFFTYTVAGQILGMQVEQALMATFFSGIFYAMIALTPARHYIAKLLPKNIKLSIGAMIGLFLAYVGLTDSGIIVSAVVSKTNATLSPGTGTKLGNFTDPFVLVAITILILSFILHFMKVKGAVIVSIIIGIILIAILKSVGITDAENAFKLQSYGEFSKFGELSSGMWKTIGSSLSNGKFYIAVFVFLYIDFFDTTGTLFSIGEQTGLNKDPVKAEKWLKDANMVDAGSTIMGSILLTSTTTSLSESFVGVSQGARTGFSSVVVAMCFGLAIAIWPIMGPILPIKHIQEHVAASRGAIMPITGPILVLVGALMISQLKFFEWDQVIDIPVLFITLIFGMLGYSISTGIAAGIIMYYIMNISALIISHFNPNFKVIDESIKMAKTKGDKNRNPNFRARVINPIMSIMFLLSVIYFATMPLYYS